VEVEEFGIFFPPRLYKRRTKAGWIFTINLLPLGGFVKLKGEHDSDLEPGTFGSASLWVKSKIMAAGVVMNLLAAFALLTILALIGLPKLIPNQFSVKSDAHLQSQQVLIGAVEPNSPASRAGLKAEDVITDISLPGYSPVAVNDFSKLPSVTKSFAGKKVIVYYQRNGHEYQAMTTLLSANAVAASIKANNQKGYLVGITPTQLDMVRYTWSAPVVAVGLCVQITELTYQGLAHAVGGLGSIVAGFVSGNKTARQNGQTNASAQVAGPVGIFVILKDGSLLGYQFILFIIAIISLTLAIMNILPIPALDGGRLWINLIAHGIKKPLSAGTEELINMAGFAILVGLLILITFVDVNRFF
jgi:regulator of sigma E protease